MARSLGFHRGPRTCYALVEKPGSGPAEVLAAGRCTAGECVALHRRLSGERHLPWAMAVAGDPAASANPVADWPLRRPAPGGLLDAAVAAAWWEWERGTIGAGDVFLWLRADALLWSSGEPGTGHAGLRPRLGPLRELVARVLAESGAGDSHLVVAVEGDAPGEEILMDALARSGRPWRRIAGRPEERGADRAAAGAALAALDPHHPGVRPARRPRVRDPWIVTASILAAAGVGGAAWLQAGHPWPSMPAPPAAVRPAAPEVLGRPLARRRAMVQALQRLLAAAPPGSVEDLEIQGRPGGDVAEVRLRLGPGAAISWTRGVAGAGDLEERRLADGSIILQGPWRLQPQDGAGRDTGETASDR